MFSDKAMKKALSIGLLRDTPLNERERIKEPIFVSHPVLERLVARVTGQGEVGEAVEGRKSEV